MADEIIDLSSFIARRAESEATAGTMALWGADGERSRFALPLWRIVQLAGAERGSLFWRSISADAGPRPFVVLDLGSDPARLDLPDSATVCTDHEAAALHDKGPEGLIVCLGAKDDRVWGLLADGAGRRPPLPPKKREDILFLAGECAGLLVLRDFADQAED
jgi:hypothetical protein